MTSAIKRLSQLRPEVWAWMTYDFANSAFATSLTAVIFNKYYAGVIAGGARGTDFQCLGYRWNLPGATLFELAVLFGTILTIALSPFLGVYADLHQAKKRLLLATILIGSIATFGLAGVHSGDVLLGGFLYGVAMCAFFLSLNFYNAFLPLICSPRDIGLVSGISWAIGYIGGGLCLLLNLIMLESPGLLGFAPGTFSVSHVVISVGLWWLVFSLPILLLVREKPLQEESIGRPEAGLPQLPASRAQRPTENQSLIRLIWKNLYSTLKNIRHFRQLWIFLLAYLFFTNGIETVINSASIFGDQELHMDTAALIKLFLLVQFTAFPGAILFGLLVDRWGNKRSLVLSLVIWVVAIVWVYNLGIFLPPVTEFHLAAVLVGLVLGGSQAAARSLFASFTPRRQSAEFFSFFGVAGRLAAVLGPVAFAIINTTTRSLRQTVLSLILFFLLGLVILLRVNEAEGLRVVEQTRPPPEA